MGFVAAIVSAISASAVASFVVKLVISYAIGKVMQDRAMSRMKANAAAASASRAIMINKSSNSDPIPVIYGKTRIGGSRAYIDTSNGAGDLAGDEYLNMALAMSEGEIGDIKQLWFNDLVVWDIDNGGTFTNGGLSGFISTYAPALTNGDIVFHSGADT